jgi:hypothetical protein
MDELVLKAMAKWPNVPDCFGWLGLDSRGHWHMRDDRVQQLGAFQSGQAGAKGSLLLHEKLIEFIHRNYAVDGQGRWYFQNGPQRVYVELEVTPWIWRIDANFNISAQTGEKVDALACLVDETGKVYLNTSLGLGLVHTLDVPVLAKAIESGLWEAQDCYAKDLPQKYGYVLSPQNN